MIDIFIFVGIAIIVICLVMSAVLMVLVGILEIISWVLWRLMVHRERAQGGIP